MTRSIMLLMIAVLLLSVLVVPVNAAQTDIASVSYDDGIGEGDVDGDDGEPPPALLGDVDGDRIIEIRDATWIQRKIDSMKLPFIFVAKRADVDGNGDINIIDATAIQYYLVRIKNPYQIGKAIL